MFETILRHPDWVIAQFEGGTWKKECSSGMCSNGDLYIETRLDKDRLCVFVTAEQTPVTLVRLRWNFQNPLKGTVLSDCWERTYGDVAWGSMTPLRAMPWYFLVHRDNTTAGYGVKVRPGALCFWQADPAGVSLWLDVRSGGSGVILNGRKLLAAQVVCHTYENMRSFEAAQQFCRVMCDDPIFPPHPVYGSNNWYYAYGHSSETEILQDTDYIIRLTEGLENRPYMVIDDCWQKNRCDEYIGGPWVSNEKFPDMQGLAEKIQQKGARPGIWVRFLLDRSENIPEEWRLSHTKCLDPSHPQVIAHIKEDISRICGWGYRLIKHDFSTFDIFGKWGFQMRPLMTGDGWHFYDRSRTSAEIVTNFYREILDSACDTNTLILGCNTIGHLGAGLMHMHRTGDDTSGLIWEQTVWSGINTLAFRMPQHRTFFDIDADCLGVTESIPWKYNRLWGELLGKSGTSLFVSVKPGVLTKQENEELAGFLRNGSIQQHIAEPLDWMETSVPQDWKSGDELLHFNWYGDCGLHAVQTAGGFWNPDRIK